MLAATTPVALAQPKPPVRLSVSTLSVQSDGASHFIAASRDRRHVLFRSVATNLVPADTNNLEDLFVRDRDTDRDGLFDETGSVATTRVNVSTAGDQTTTSTLSVAFSPNGRFVLFTTESALIAGDTNALTDVYVRDRDSDGNGVFDEQGGTSTTRASESSSGLQGTAVSQGLGMTPDGRFVLLESTAPVFTPSPTNGISQIYRKDRQTGALTLVSTLANGLPFPFLSSSPTMSDDGRVVSFQARFMTAPPVFAGPNSIYVRDLSANSLVELSPDLTLSSATTARTMWFPGPEVTPNFWTEANSSPGTTTTATRWVLADGEEGGAAHTRTYVLVANTSSSEGRFDVTVLPESGVPMTSSYVVPANSRTTVPIGVDFPAAAQSRFGVIVESQAAGTNVLGTPIP